MPSRHYSLEYIQFTFPINHKKPVNDDLKGKVNDSHLKVSAWRTWQLAWCSNWSSSHRKFWQKEQRKIRPPGQKVKWWFLVWQRCDLVKFNQKEEGGQGSYHDPRHCDHTLCSPHQSGDMHRRECSDISYRGIPKLHRSHILPPYGQEDKINLRQKGC